VGCVHVAPWEQLLVLRSLKLEYVNHNVYSSSHGSPFYYHYLISANTVTLASKALDNSLGAEVFTLPLIISAVPTWPQDALLVVPRQSLTLLYI
jgi:hypothetical protein